jgi:cation:H+ antiporter
MAPAAAVPLFLVSLAVTVIAARMFARRLDVVGIRFGLPEALIGLLTAIAADGPNVSSALYALVRGAHNVGVGVLVGSNAFQLAAMVGVSALLAGSVLMPREGLLLEGLTGTAVTAIAAAALFGWIAPLVAVGLGACVAVPYLVVVIGGSELLLKRRDAHRTAGRLGRFVDQRPRTKRSGSASAAPVHHLVGLIVLDVALIIASSAGMVQAALSLGGDWQISRAVLGVLVLAPLTSIPNAITGVRLGVAGRSAALVSETLNSNTINLGIGVLVPALFTTFGVLTATGKLQLVWLLGMTVICVGLLTGRGGMGRRGGTVLIALYIGFAALAALGS